MICSAVLRLPSRISVLMNLVTSALLYSGSSGTSRFGISLRRGIKISFQLTAASYQQASLAGSRKLGAGSPLRLRPLCAVLRSTLFPALHADRVERAADDVVAHARKI